MDRAPVLYLVDPDSIPAIPYGTTGVILTVESVVCPEHIFVPPKPKSNSKTQRWYSR